MSILDASVNVGLETTYGSAVTPTRSMEAQSDNWTRAQSRLESVGFRNNMQALRSDRVKTVNMGGAGNITSDFMTNGAGLLLGGAFGSKVAPVQQEATAAYLQTFATTDAAPADSFTVQVIRPKMESGVQQFTHHGAKITGWNLSQGVDGLLVWSVDFDSEDVDITTAAATPAFPSGAVPFDWTQCTATLDPDGSPSTLDLLDLSFSAELGLKTDRRYLRGSALKKEPVRSGIPSYSGEMSIDFSSTDQYAQWTAGTDLDLELKWTGAVIAGAHSEYFSLRFKAINWTDGNPVVSLLDTPVQSLPFQVMHNGSDAAITATYMSTDTVA